VERHCSNPQCFVRKVTVFSPHDQALLQSSILINSILKKKSTKIILKKNITKKDNTKETGKK
jgi:hypothetical protein